jgi:hypothetical protein
MSGKLTTIALLMVATTCLLHPFAFPNGQPMSKVILFILGGANLVMALLHDQRTGGKW